LKLGRMNVRKLAHMSYRVLTDDTEMAHLEGLTSNTTTCASEEAIAKLKLCISQSSMGSRSFPHAAA